MIDICLLTQKPNITGGGGYLDEILHCSKKYGSDRPISGEREQLLGRRLRSAAKSMNSGCHILE